MYISEIILNQNTGNNAFSYYERKRILGKAEITIPSIKTISNINKIKIGKHTIFEEIDHKNILKSCKGLKNIYKIVKRNIDIYIFDNHNHALFFWIKLLKGKSRPIQLIHIDQHSDLNTPPKINTKQKNNLEYIRNYTNYICNVGNFIPAFIECYPKTKFTRVKSESQLLTQKNSYYSPPSSIIDSSYIKILDIDLDFRAPEMGIENYKETIEITKKLIKKSTLTTIATSPYFLNQNKALEILNDLFRTN